MPKKGSTKSRTESQEALDNIHATADFVVTLVDPMTKHTTERKQSDQRSKSPVSTSSRSSNIDESQQRKDKRRRQVYLAQKRHRAKQAQSQEVLETELNLLRNLSQNVYQERCDLLYHNGIMQNLIASHISNERTLPVTWSTTSRPDECIEMPNITPSEPCFEVDFENRSNTSLLGSQLDTREQGTLGIWKTLTIDDDYIFPLMSPEVNSDSWDSRDSSLAAHLTDPNADLSVASYRELSASTASSWTC